MITYNAINVPLPEIEQDKVSEWIGLVAASYGKRIDQVNYIFVDDALARWHKTALCRNAVQPFREPRYLVPLA